MSQPAAHDRLSALYDVADRYTALFPDGDEPFKLLARLAEEVGEVTTEVQRLEGSGAKVAKLGVGSIDDLASEIEDVLHTLMALTRYYKAESALDHAIEREWNKTGATPPAPVRRGGANLPADGLRNRIAQRNSQPLAPLRPAVSWRNRPVAVTEQPDSEARHRRTEDRRWPHG